MNNIPERYEKYIGWKLPENHFAVSKLMMYVISGELEVNRVSGIHNESLYIFEYKKEEKK